VKTPIEIVRDDLSGEATRDLLRLHLRQMHESSPPGTSFALDLTGLQSADVMVWSGWLGPSIAGVAALKDLGNGCGEVKSMRTHPRFLRQGVAAQLLEHIIRVAQDRGMHRLSLETGSGPAFEPALALYRRRGFMSGPAFGSYPSDSSFNQYFHLDLRSSEAIPPANPWTAIPLADYEAHMALPTVGQAELIASELARAVEAHRPGSVAVLGCAGGNGLDRLIGSSARRVVAIDINPSYAAATEARLRGRIEELEVIVANVEDDANAFDPVDLVYAALILEYVDLGRALTFMRRHCRPEGTLFVMLQLPSAKIAEVTPSPYVSLRQLEPILRLVTPAELRRRAAESGFRAVGSRLVTSAAGKSFALEEFSRRVAGDSRCLDTPDYRDNTAMER
jgi:putative acetyltransferase